MRAAKRAGPRQAASRDGFVTAVRPLRTVTASTVLTENETWTSSRSPGGAVRVASSVTGAKRARSLRAKIAIAVRAAIFRAAIGARYLVTIVSAESAGIG